MKLVRRMQEFECCGHVFTEIIREDGVIQRVANKQPVEWNFCPICGERIPWVGGSNDSGEPEEDFEEIEVDTGEETVTLEEDDVFEEVAKMEKNRPIRMPHARNLQDYLDQEIELEKKICRKRPKIANYRILSNLNLIKHEYGCSSKPAYKLQKQPVFDPRKYLVPQFA